MIHPQNIRRMRIIDQAFNTLVEVGKKSLQIDESLLTNEMCVEFGCTKRSAKEYLEMAKAKFEKYKRDLVSEADVDG